MTEAVVNGALCNSNLEVQVQMTLIDVLSIFSTAVEIRATATLNRTKISINQSD